MYRPFATLQYCEHNLRGGGEGINIKPHCGTMFRNIQSLCTAVCATDGSVNSGELSVYVQIPEGLQLHHSLSAAEKSMKFKLTVRT